MEEEVKIFCFIKIALTIQSWKIQSLEVGDKSVDIYKHQFELEYHMQ